MRIFWIVYGVLLLLCEALFILRVQAVWRVFMRIKKSYALAPEAIADGHRQRETRSELRPALLRCRTELLSWAAIAVVTGYAVADCVVFNIMR